VEKMTFYSHPGKLLKDHLAEVMDKALVHAAEYKELIEVMALMHDFGKYTSFFQEYLETHIENKPWSNHGFISAVAASYIVAKKGGEQNPIAPLIVYSGILSHHGSLKSLQENNMPRKLREFSPSADYELHQKIKVMLKQLEDLQKNREAITKEYIGTAVELYLGNVFDLDEEEIKEHFKQLLKLRIKHVDRSEDSQYYYMHQYTYSLLIWADKNSAAAITPPKAQYGAFDKLNKAKEMRIRKKAQGKVSALNAMRSCVFDQVLKETEVAYQSDILTITSPTGSGKTYTGFLAAVKVRELSGLHGKIIYALPFTSIINQNYDELKNLYEKSNYMGNEYLMMHHYLSSRAYESSSSEYEKYDLAQFQEIFDGWQSGVIVTTFVQLLETIVSVKNKMLKKFNSFYNSVILIDEVQALDAHYYQLLEQVINDAVKYLHCKFIIMTATRPLICSNARELLTEHERYFAGLNRTKIIYDPKPLTIDQFLDGFMEEYNEDKSYMILCNTVQCSIEIYNKLQKIACGGECIFYLSSNIISKQKEEVIRAVSDLQKKKTPHILVTTQVVEAGVDFSFDIIYRDMAPMPSIIQTAGRSNRHGDDSTGFVYVINLISEINNKRYAALVYRLNVLSVTEKILERYKIVFEKDYFQMINDYYNDMAGNISNEKSKNIIKGMNTLKFEDEELKNFSLIENRSQEDVFCVVDSDAEKIFDEYIAAFSIKEKKQQKNAFVKLKPKVAMYTVAVSTNHLTSEMEKKLGDRIIYYIDKELCSMDGGLYNTVTGVMRRIDKLDTFY